jgi:hypothetical protein
MPPIAGYYRFQYASNEKHAGLGIIRDVRGHATGTGGFNRSIWSSDWVRLADEVAPLQQKPICQRLRLFLYSQTRRNLQRGNEALAAQITLARLHAGRSADKNLQTDDDAT